MIGQKLGGSLGNEPISQSQKLYVCMQIENQLKILLVDSTVRVRITHGYNLSLERLNLVRWEIVLQSYTGGKITKKSSVEVWGSNPCRVGTL